MEPWIAAKVLDQAQSSGVSFWPLCCESCRRRVCARSNSRVDRLWSLAGADSAVAGTWSRVRLSFPPTWSNGRFELCVLWGWICSAEVASPFAEERNPCSSGRACRRRCSVNIVHL